MSTVLLIASLKLIVDANAHGGAHLLPQNTNCGTELLVVALQLLLKRLNMKLLPKPGHDALVIRIVLLKAGFKL